MDGGHVDIVRAMGGGRDNAVEPPVTGAEDSRVCAWGERKAVDSCDGGYIQAGGKIGRRRRWKATLPVLGRCEVALAGNGCPN